MNKDEFRREAKQEIDEMVNTMEKLEAKKNEAQNDIREKYESTLAELRESKDELDNKYKRLKDATENNWMEAKTSFKNASREFKQGLSELTTINS